MTHVRATPSIDISVVVPTYKGAASLPELVARLDAFFASRQLHGEVVLVNDSSPDDTWPVIERVARLHSSVVAIDLMSNEGQALATLCGIAHARACIGAGEQSGISAPGACIGARATGSGIARHRDDA